MNKPLLIVILIAGLNLSLSSHADILRIDQNALKGKVVLAEDAPTRGMNKSAVIKKLGAPSERTTSVGNPPISSWLYPGYRVYFEYNHVIHTVSQ